MLQTDVRKKMEECKMTEPGDRLIVGLSGGADSVCLLLVLKDLSGELGFGLSALHVEHGIRGAESYGDREFVISLCKKEGIPLTVVSVDVPAKAKGLGLGEEETARILRYEAFEAEAKRLAAKIVLGHHMEDDAETVLFQLIRGSRLAGLCGMQPVRVSQQKTTYLRPLLGLHRSQIEEELQRRGQAFCTDSTNLDPAYSRNRMRHLVIPELKEINSEAVAHIHEAAEYLTMVRSYIREEEEKSYQGCVETADDTMGLRKSIRVDALLNLHPLLQQEILYRMMTEVLGAKKDVSAVHVEAVQGLLNKQSGRSIRLPQGLCARRTTDAILIEKNPIVREKEPPVEEIEVSEDFLNRLMEEKGDGFLSLGDKKLRIRIFAYDGDADKIPKKRYTKWLDYDKIKKGFFIRHRRPQDCIIMDASGHEKKLKKYLIDEKIPQNERDMLWVLAEGSTVFWVIGGRVGEDRKVTKTSKMVVELEYIGG